MTNENCRVLLAMDHVLMMVHTFLPMRENTSPALAVTPAVTPFAEFLASSQLGAVDTANDGVACNSPTVVGINSYAPEDATNPLGMFITYSFSGNGDKLKSKKGLLFSIRILSMQSRTCHSPKRWKQLRCRLQQQLIS